MSRTTHPNVTEAHDPRGDAPTGWAMPVITLLGTAVAVVLAFVGSGALGGTPVAEAAGGQRLRSARDHLPRPRRRHAR